MGFAWGQWAGGGRRDAHAGQVPVSAVHTKVKVLLPAPVASHIMGVALVIVAVTVMLPQSAGETETRVRDGPRLTPPKIVPSITTARTAAAPPQYR